MVKYLIIPTILFAGACRTVAPNQDFVTAQRPGLVEVAPKSQEPQKPSGTQGVCPYRSETWTILILRDAIVIRPDVFYGTWTPDQHRREFNYSEAEDGKIITHLTTPDTVYILTSNGWIFATSPGKEHTLYKQELKSGWTEGELSMKRYCLGDGRADVIVTVDGKELFIKYLGEGKFDIFE